MSPSPMSAPWFWISPLVLLPGVALLILSTAMRSGQLHEELHRVLGDAREGEWGRQLIRRAALFRNALVGFYAAVALLALASLLGGFVRLLGHDGVGVVVGLTCAGIVALLAGAGLLTWESVLYYQVFRRHLEELERRQRPPVI